MMTGRIGIEGINKVFVPEPELTGVAKILDRIKSFFVSAFGSKAYQRDMLEMKHALSDIRDRHVDVADKIYCFTHCISLVKEEYANIFELEFENDVMYFKIMGETITGMPLMHGETLIEVGPTLEPFSLLGGNVRYKEDLFKEWYDVSQTYVHSDINHSEEKIKNILSAQKFINRKLPLDGERLPIDFTRIIATEGWRNFKNAETVTELWAQYVVGEIAKCDTKGAEAAHASGRDLFSIIEGDIPPSAVKRLVDMSFTIQDFNGRDESEWPRDFFTPLVALEDDFTELVSYIPVSFINAASGHSEIIT